MLAVVGLTRTEPPCAYVLGQAGTTTVATPAVVVFVSPEEAGAQPVRVHLDEEGQSILGYSLRAPGADAPADADRVFVPGLAQVGRALGSLLEASAPRQTCESLGVSTPAVPIRVPITAFDLPGALVETPSITLQLSDRLWSAPGHVLSLRGSTLVLPVRRLRDTGIPWSVAEPLLSVDLGGELRTARFLAPRLPPESHPNALPSLPLKDDPTRSARINLQQRERPGSPGTAGAPRS